MRRAIFAGQPRADCRDTGGDDVAKLEGVSKRYGDLTVYEDFDFLVRRHGAGRVLRLYNDGKDGAIYFPSEVYPHFGIQPFTAAPKVEGDLLINEKIEVPAGATGQPGQGKQQVMQTQKVKHLIETAK